jgi:hypothetical protein
MAKCGEVVLTFSLYIMEGSTTFSKSILSNIVRLVARMAREDRRLNRTVLRVVHLQKSIRNVSIFALGIQRGFFSSGPQVTISSQLV